MNKLILFFCTLAVTACASIHIAPQALQMDDQDLSSIKHQLAMFSVHIRPLNANLKLRGMVVRNLDTDEGYSLPFFNNAILGSKALPNVITGEVIEHLILLDLPEGRYALKRIGFAQFADAGAYSEVMQHQLARSVQFEVGDGVTYLGRLSLSIGKLKVTDTVYSASPVALQQEFNKYAGEVTIAIGSDAAEDIQKAQQRYPALAQQQFAIGSLTFEP